MLDTKELAAATAFIVKEHVGAAVKAAVDPLLRRIEELEQRAPARGEPGRDGIDVKDGAPGADGSDGKDGRDGKDAELTAEQLASAVAEYLAANPPAAGKDGRDGENGRDGKDGEPGRDGIDGKDGAPGADGKDGRNGLDVKDLFRAEGGRLIAVLSDGSTKDLGVFVGRDGKDGEPGRDGRDGKGGADGLGFDDLAVDHDGERGFIFRLRRGDQIKEFGFAIPAMIYRGVYAEGKSYDAGDTVTWGGHLWHCNEATSEKPLKDGGVWTLAAKRGRDGREVVTVKPRKDEPVKV